jgi:hypothetical protein
VQPRQPEPVSKTPEILVEMLHPEIFEPRRLGTAWRRYAR